MYPGKATNECTESMELMCGASRSGALRLRRNADWDRNIACTDLWRFPPLADRAFRCNLF